MSKKNLYSFFSPHQLTLTLGKLDSLEFPKSNDSDSSIFVLAKETQIFILIDIHRFISIQSKISSYSSCVLKLYYINITDSS